MKTVDRIVLGALALGIWAWVGAVLAGAEPVRAQAAPIVDTAVRAALADCRVVGSVTGAVSGRAEGTVAGEVQVQHGSFGVIQNGRIGYARVTGTLEDGRIVNGRIECPAGG